KPVKHQPNSTIPKLPQILPRHKTTLTKNLGTKPGTLQVAISLVFFAFSTVLGWAYYGERCIERLAGLKAVAVYRIVFAVVLFVGCISSIEVAWVLADISNALMAIPNLIGLVLASGLIARETRDYLRRDPKLRAAG
ncbi:alanine:cation symporter family protein, partial [Mobiluncus curtisii]